MGSEIVEQFVPIPDPSSKCWFEWTAHETLGAGRFGGVVAVCKEDDCNWVMKISALDSLVNDEYEIKEREDAADRETYFYSLLKNRDWVVKMHTAWNCVDSDGKRYKFLVLEKFDGNIDETIEEESGKEILKQELLDKMVEITKKLSEAGVVHGDLKPDAFLFKEPEEGATSIADYKIALSDFGLSGDFKNYYPKMGWMRSAEYQCQNPTEFNPYINLWQLEESLLRIGVWIEGNDGLYKFTGFQELPDSQRQALRKTCTKQSNNFFFQPKL